jgi:hypothetical protein
VGINILGSEFMQPREGLRLKFAETSCGAAIRVKPKVRLCEPWVVVQLSVESREAATERTKVVLITVIAAAPSGLDHFV